jgi:2-polyprenyl-3-methyl-5-hydroxy-6-metoxy-1,4-benzoquinol methylase
MYNIYSLLDEIRSEDKEYFLSSIPRYIRFLKKFSEIQNDGSSKEILDVGCSPGHLAISLARMGHNVTGIDLNDEYLVKYPPKWLKEISRKQWNIENNRLDFNDECFDYILFTEILEHIAITHPSIILSDLLRLLKPGGVLYLTTPNVSCFTNILELVKNKNIFWDPDIFYGSLDRHNREFTSRDIEKILKIAGIKNYNISFFSTWGNTKQAPVHLIKFLIQHNFNNRILDNTIEVICKK